MRLFHIPGSRSTRVLWTLEEIGAPYDISVLGREEKNSDAHRARHPLGRVPVLELDDGSYVFESAAICLYLGDLHPEAGVLPAAGTTERALAFQWTVFTMSELEPAVFGWLRARRADEDETAPAARLGPLQETLTTALGDRPWILGEAFSVADVFLASLLGTVVRRELGDPGPSLQAYAERALERPANVRAEAIGR